MQAVKTAQMVRCCLGAILFHTHLFMHKRERGESRPTSPALGLLNLLADKGLRVLL